MSGAIKELTHGVYTHAAWLCSDQLTIAEAFYPHVRKRPLEAVEEAGIDLFTLQGMTPDLAAKFERFFDIATLPGLVQEYSIKGLFDYEFNFSPEHPQEVFCSQWVLQSIRKNAHELMPVVRVDGDAASPVELSHSPLINLVVRS